MKDKDKVMCFFQPYSLETDFSLYLDLGWHQLSCHSSDLTPTVLELQTHGLF